MMPPMPSEPSRRDLRLILGVQGLRAFLYGFRRVTIGAAPAAERVHVFGRYNAVAYLAGALGALAAGGPAAFRHLFPGLPADQRFLLVFPVLAVACSVLASELSDAVEGARRVVSAPAIRRREPLRSRSTIRRLAALFALDSFGGGFIVQSFLAFWFHRKYGTSVETPGLVFF